MSNNSRIKGTCSILEHIGNDSNQRYITKFRGILCHTYKSQFNKIWKRDGLSRLFISIVPGIFAEWGSCRGCRSG